uniref:BRCA2 DNA repair associated n=1 Tax=Hucho hucho TaxID=62062 RepID=A0A4W5KC32_9TELE
PKHSAVVSLQIFFIKIFLFQQAHSVKRVSESLGAQIDPDMSWTSSLNTPVMSPTIILNTGTDYFSGIAPGLDSHLPGVIDNSPGFQDTLPGDSGSHWKQTLQDAIEDREIRSTMAGVLDGSEDVLSIFFSNSSLALQRVKTKERIKRKQSGAGTRTKEHVPTSTMEHDKVSSERAGEYQHTRETSEPLESRTDMKSGDLVTSQWTPINVPDISGYDMDSFHHEGSSSTKHIIPQDGISETFCDFTGSQQPDRGSSKQTAQVESALSRRTLPRTSQPEGSHLTGSVVESSLEHTFPRKTRTFVYYDLIEENMTDVVTADSEVKPVLSCVTGSRLSTEVKFISPLNVAKRSKQTSVKLNGQFHVQTPQSINVSVSSHPGSGFKMAFNKKIHFFSANLEKDKDLFKEIEDEIPAVNIPEISLPEEGNMSCGLELVDGSHLPPLPYTHQRSVDCQGLLTASQSADVSELCSLLEAADSQFEFTQFKPAKLNFYVPDGSPPRQSSEKELDPDFLTGIDFDDSFNSDVEKQSVKMATPDKKTTISHCKRICQVTTTKIKSSGASPSSSTEKPKEHVIHRRVLYIPSYSSENIAERSFGLLTKTTNNHKLLDMDTNTSGMECERKNLPKLGVGFKTAGGNAMIVSEKCLSKARALFADLEETNTEQVETSPVQYRVDTNVDSNVIHFHGPEKKVDLKEPRDEYIDKIKVDFTHSHIHGDGGFQTASGKVVTISAKALEKTNALFKDCDSMESSGCASEKLGKTSVVSETGSNNLERNNCGFSTARGKRVDVSAKSLQKARTLLNDCDELENSKPGKIPSLNAKMPSQNIQQKSDCDFKKPSSKAASISAKIPLTAKTPSFDGGTSHDVLGAKSKMLEPENSQTHVKDPLQKGCGFSTASGKRVSVSEGALLKAQALLSECNVDGEELSKSKKKIPVDLHTIQNPTQKHSGFKIASVKEVTVSPKALKQAKAVFNNCDSNMDSLISAEAKQGNIDVKSADGLMKNPGKSYCAFMTAGGKNVHVSEKGILKAKSILNENLDNCTDSNAIDEAWFSDGRFSLLTEDGTGVKKEASNKSNSSDLNGDEKSCDFSTASGKTVHLSDGALQKAKSILNECDVIENPQHENGHNVHLEKIPTKETHEISHEKALQEAYDDTLASDIDPHKRSEENRPLKVPTPHTNVQRVPVKAAGLEDREMIQTIVGMACQSSSVECQAESSLLHFESLGFSGCSVTQRRYFAQEAMDCTKALLEDEDLTDQSPGTPIQANPMSCKGGFEMRSGIGKRSAEDLGMTGKIYSTSQVWKHLLIQGLVYFYYFLHCRIICLQLARDMQDMRIRKKKRQTIRPLPGSLYLAKTSGVARLTLREAVGGWHPVQHTHKQLYGYGVHRHVSDICSESAEAFRFVCRHFFRREAFVEGRVQLADGGCLIPRNDGTAGKHEFHRALCDTPGVDPKLISEDWVFNHYRWVVWKRACMERAFPAVMGSLCLTPEQVLLQLKYRYDLEVDNSKRSALRKIMERDDTAVKTLALCVCGVVTKGSKAKSSPVGLIWLTDGWYAIKAQLDVPLTAMLHRGRLAIGGKVLVHGAELVGSQDACSPLEAPDSLMLKIGANGTRVARWYTRLGFYSNPSPFLLPLSSLYSNGGPVGCVDIVVLRSYPTQWMEKKPDGGFVFRAGRAEEREARRYGDTKHRAMEILFAKIQAQFEKEEDVCGKPRGRRRTLRGRDIETLLDGEELYDAVENDPVYLEGRLSEQQREALNNYRRCVGERRQAALQERFRQALESAQEGEGGSCHNRDVTPIWKLSVADSRANIFFKLYSDQGETVYLLNIWRPSMDLQSLLKEGCRYRAYQLSTSEGKKRAGNTSIQLTATKKTQFQNLQASAGWLSERFQAREAVGFSVLLNRDLKPLCGEVDLVGYVISITDRQGWLFIRKCKNIISCKYISLVQQGLDEVVKPLALVALSNLQLRAHPSSSPPIRSAIPGLYAGDLVSFSTNPKEPHLQEAAAQLRTLVQVMTPQQSVPSVGPFTPLNRVVSPPPACSSGGDNKDPKSLKRKRGLDYLCRIPSPPPLSPLGTMTLPSPCVNKTFNPPRRAETHRILKTPLAPAPQHVHLPLEDEWVEDEELAMIDTQALHDGIGIDIILCHL